jgi:DNA end-binding protein Ku
LVLELMHFADELVGPDALHLPAKVAVGKGEMDMAKTLISRMTQKWEPGKYQDDYKSALVELIDKKLESGCRTPKASKAKTKPSTNVIDLMAVLRQSLGESQKSRTKSGTAKRSTHRKREA